MLSEQLAPLAVLVGHHQVAWRMAHLHSVYLLPELLQSHLLGLQLQETGEGSLSHLHPCLYVYLAQGLMIGSLAAPHLQPPHVVSLPGSSYQTEQQCIQLWPSCSCLQPEQNLVERVEQADSSILCSTLHQHLLKWLLANGFAANMVPTYRLSSR